MSLQILLVEDHIAVAEAFKHLLEGENWQVTIARSPSNAMRLLTHLNPDIGLIDLEFSATTVTGFALAQQVAKKCPHTRILFLTMHDDAVLSEHARRTGAAGFLGKCASSSDICAAIRTVATGSTWFPEKRTLPLCRPTPRELQVIYFLGRGLRYEEIANTMGISVRTVRFHLVSAGKICGTRTVAQLVCVARQRGWFLMPTGSESLTPAVLSQSE